MPVISSFSNDIPVATGSNAQVAANTATNSSGQAASDASGDAADSNSVALSTRAQKIQKLNEDFFPGGAQTLKITPAFIERLKEYGFISADEAGSLSRTATSTATGEPAGTLGELTDFIDRFSAELKEQQPDSSLVATLQKAGSVIDNFDGSSPSTLASDIKTVGAELNQYLSSEAADSLSRNDRASLEQLEMAMKIADKLNPENLSSSKVNSYLAVLSRSL